MTYKPPRYTMVPNALLDDDMKNMGKAELKILLATCRKTFGWQKERDRISYTQFEKLTGLSRSSVVDGINAGIKRGILRKHLTKAGNEYSLNIDPYPDDVPVAGTQAIPVGGHTKETIKKKHTGDFIDMALSQKKRVEFPPDVDELLQVFTKKFGRVVTDGEYSMWVKAAKSWRQMGVRPDDVGRMWDFCKGQPRPLAIKSPHSITFAFDEIRNEDKALAANHRRAI